MWHFLSVNMLITKVTFLCKETRQLDMIWTHVLITHYFPILKFPVKSRVT